MILRELLTALGFQVDDKAIKTFESSVTSLKSTIKGLAAVGGAAAGALFGVALSTAKAGDEAAKTSSRLGMEIEQYQELAHAAQISGTSITAVGTGYKTLAKNVNDAGLGLKTSIDKFKQLGISTKNADGTTKDINVLFEELADKFASMPDGIKKTALAQDLFGRSGLAMINMLNSGSKGIQKMRQEARDLGMVLNEAQAKGSEEFVDSLTRLKGVLTGIKNTIGVAIIPMIQKMMDSMKDWFLANRKIIAQNLETVLKELAGMGFLMVKAFAGLLKIGVPLLKFLVGTTKEGKALRKILLLLVVAVKGVMVIQALIAVVKGLGLVFNIAGIKALFMNAAILAIPLLIAAIVVAIGLLAEDLYQLFTGGESAIAKLLLYIEKAGDFFLGVWETIWKAIKSSASALFNILAAPWIALWDLISPIIDAIGNFGSVLGFDTGSMAGKAAGPSPDTMATVKATGGNVSKNQNVSVNKVNVTVQGTTNMSEAEMSRAVSKGMTNGLDTSLQALDASTDGAAI